MKKPTFHEGQRVLIRKRKPRYDKDYPDIAGRRNKKSVVGYFGLA